jgi:hypothetical protein
MQQQETIERSYWQAMAATDSGAACDRIQSRCKPAARTGMAPADIAVGINAELMRAVKTLVSRPLNFQIGKSGG